MITYITLTISIISFVFSAFIFFSNALSRRYKLGISVNESIPNIEKQTLFLRISFLNESSAPITIQNLFLLDSSKQRFHDYGKPNEDGFSAGDIIQRKMNVESSDINSDFIAGNSETCYLPFVIQPYSSYTGFFAFYFQGEDARIINNYPDIFIEAETSKGFFTVPKGFAANYFRTEETRDKKVRPIHVYWNLSASRKLFPFLKRSLLSLKQKLSAKVKHILNRHRH